MNQRDFNYAGIDSRNVKESLYISCCEWSKMFTTNLKSTIYQEQQGQSAWFFACWDKLKEEKSWFYLAN